jgi:hypothetical protein
MGRNILRSLKETKTDKVSGLSVTFYEQFVGPMSRKVWNELQKMWAGKSSLMDVIRAEQKNK